jgi:uncharacterized membrane protein
MDKMVIIVFDNEAKAYEGVKALRELHDEASVTVYGSAVLVKDASGKILVKEADTPGPAGTILGLTVGSLVGLLGGPIGMAAGAATGAMSGSVYDLAQLGVGEDFLVEASASLSPGKAAIVADLNEEWVTPLDTRMEALGAVVLRRARAEVIDAQLEREIAAEKAEFAKLKAEYNHAIGEAKAKLKGKLDAARKKAETRRDQLKAKIEAIKNEGEGKLTSLQLQASRARGDITAKLEKRRSEMRADYQKRKETLNEALKLFKDDVA